ncbi:hypothetical protein IQ24_03786 [Paracoccus sulfuroxidans]|uniref:Uncharacterized protein n=2 Tax=Paracoccus sulfuroxidans TaxID=384678 RepID=A0A562N7L4_9RHOB|nr:hypothetical protein IQ24_03786 [Paracoccus sulfuroxidans]
MRAHDALKRLVIDPHSESAMAVLDIIRRDFDAAELPLSDMANGDAVRINLLQEEIARAQYESCNWQEREQAARQRIEGQDTQIGELNTELRRLEADQQVLTQSLNDAREREQAATQRIEGQDTQIGELNAELRRLETDQQVLTQSLNDAREREQAATQRIEGQDTQIGELNTELRRLETDQQVLTQSLNDAREREQAAKQQIEEQLSQILEMTLSLTDAQEMLGWHERKLAEMNELLHNRNLDYDKLQLISQLRVDQIYKTRSWRVTAPMRQVSTKLRNIRIAVNTFQSASRNLGGPLAAASATTRILVKEGPRGIGRRLSRHRYIAHLDAQGVNKSSAHQCYIAATPHVMSLAQLMARVLREEGFLVSVGTDLDGADGATHVFVICPQMFDNIPEHYIAVQMEQSVSSRWFTEAYFDSLNRARAIIDYSMTNLDYLGRHDLPLYKLHYIPLDVDRNLLPSDEAPRQGILFYGDDKCPRRQRILSAVADAYPQLRIVNNLFGEEIDQELKRAAVVLNVHYYEGSLLETTRIYQALSHGTPVVSEVSADQDEHAVLHGIVEFAPVDDTDRIIELLRPYIDNDIHAIAQRERIRSFTARDDNRFEMFFRRFLLAQNMVGYDVMSTRAPNYPISVPEPAHLCLSLPETPRRRALFAGQMQPGFTIWDGLKATPGWIGAAMSYRHMFKRIVASGTQRAIICEDDVLFPTDYNQRMAVVERYLEHHEWDLFSGFIADAHDDIVVSAVVDFEGVRFVHVNRAVSMVFNIYNRGIMEYLAEWDPTDKDVDRNTIDRYLERREDTKVILTLPFLVGHRPDTTSTIWGFDNTQYDAVIEKSELLLTEKVEEFLRKTRSGS